VKNDKDHTKKVCQELGLMGNYATPQGLKENGFTVVVHPNHYVEVKGLIGKGKSVISSVFKS